MIDWFGKNKACLEMSLGKDMLRLNMGNYKFWENWGNIDTRQDNCGKYWSFSFYRGHPLHSSEHFSWTLVTHDKDCKSARQEHIAGGPNCLREIRDSSVCRGFRTFDRKEMKAGGPHFTGPIEIRVRSWSV